MLSDDAMITLLLIAGAVAAAFAVLDELGIDLDWDDGERRGFEVADNRSTTKPDPRRSRA